MLRANSLSPANGEAELRSSAAALRSSATCIYTQAFLHERYFDLPTKKKKRKEKWLRDNGEITSLTLLHPLPGMSLWREKALCHQSTGLEKIYSKLVPNTDFSLKRASVRAEGVCFAATKRGARFPLF